MLIIFFYGESCSFHRPVSPRLENQLNHREFKLKLELHIKNLKKRSSAKKKQATLEISQGLQNFTGVEKFRRAANFRNLRI